MDFERLLYIYLRVFNYSLILCLCFNGISEMEKETKDKSNSKRKARARERVSAVNQVTQQRETYADEFESPRPAFRLSPSLRFLL